MIIRIRSKNGMVVDVGPLVFAPDKIKKVAQEATTMHLGDEALAHIIEDYEYKLVSVITIANNENFDKELWFQKD